MKKTLPIIILLLGICNIAFTQSYKAYKEEADKAMKAKNYTTALTYYHFLVTEAGRESVDNFYNAAESARRSRVYSLAEVYYQHVANDDKGISAHPLTNFWLADAEKRQGKYFEAKAHFEAYLLESAGANATYAEKARAEIENCNWALTETNIPYNEDKEPIHLDSQVNSILTDLAPLKRDGKLYFTSIRPDMYNAVLEREKGSQWISRIGRENQTSDDIPLTTVMVKEDNKEAQSVYDAFREDTLHVAHVAFTKDGDRIVYTLCKSVNFTDTDCKLYYRDLDPQKKWGPKVALPANINMPGYTNTQPALGYDRTAKKTLLVFASNRPDGFGKMDLWCTYMNTNNTFDDPVNLSATIGAEGINTSENDITPFWDEATQTLYYSSEGHARNGNAGGNLGGYDIYKVKKNGHTWGKPENMGYPLNKYSDDVYYSVSDDGKESYFSSNRAGGFCPGTADSICTCNDIYKVELPKLKLEVLTYNKITGDELFGTKVDLDNLITGINLNDEHGEDNFFTFPVDYQFKYGLVGTKKGYSNGTGNFSTIFERTDTTIRVKLYLEPEVILITRSFDISNGDTVELEGTTVDLTSIGTIVGQPSISAHEYRYPMEWKKSYELAGNKAGYNLISITDIFEVENRKVSTIGIPVVPHVEHRNLYFCRGVELPDNISLYFDNDYPDPKTEKITTTFTYGETYRAYVKKKNTFVRRSGDRSAMESFFDNRVDKGFRDLEAFAQSIYNYFASTKDQDSRVKITILGHASKRSNVQHNKNLTERRVNSLQNHLRDWTNGAQRMGAYFNRIDITPAARGDEESKTTLKTPIADINACYERRVDILNVEVTGQCAPTEYPPVIHEPKNPLSLTVLTFDEITKEPLLGTTVELSAVKMSNKKDTRSDSHAYFYDIKTQTSYTIVGTKEGYTSDSEIHFSGDGSKNPQEVRLYLRPKTPAPGVVRLKVLTYHELTGEPLGGASVNVAAGSNNDINLESTVNNYTTTYNADWATSYQIYGSKTGYSSSQKDIFTSKGTTLINGYMEVKLYMRPVVDLTAFTYDRNGGQALTDVKVDVIRLPGSGIFKSQRDAALSRYLYQINFSESYMVIASKSGYSSDTTYVSTLNIAKEPTNMETKLYLCKNLDFSPNISLYFDNDHPDPDCERVTTPLTYKQTCDAYLANRNYFESKFASGSDGYTEMISFFDNEVSGGMARLDAFAKELYDYFKDAESLKTTVNITIRGHASLRSNPRYNLALTKRRVSSLRNYLRTWTNSSESLAPYYHRIQVTEAPRGDQEACIGCYEKSSIKDLQACKDRRVDIISATVINTCPATKKEKPSGTYRE